MTLKLSILTASIGLLALASCKKNNVEVTKTEPNNTSTKTIDAEMELYDYTQPLEKIIADAMKDDPNAKRISESQINAATVKRGKYINVNKDWYACFPEPAICMVILPEIVIHSNSSSGMSGGTNEHPIGIIEALPNGPKLRLVSEVSFEQGEDNVINVHPTYLPE